jgi:Domain of unknown function (DUF1906)
VLAPGQIASAEIEGTDIPAPHATGCTLFHRITFSLPGEISAITLTDPAPIPGCSSISVHPFVAGALGSAAPGPPSTTPYRFPRHPKRSANLSPGTSWGIDTASATSASYLSELDQNLGVPQFVGRYVVYGGGTPLQSSEASFLHDSDISIMLIVSPANGTLTSASTAVTEANQAVSAAEALGVPKGVALFRDVENDYTINSAYIIAWWQQISKAGYAPGFYENPLSGRSGFNSAYCASVAANGGVGTGLALYSDEPELHSYGYQESVAPAWAADVPSCTNNTTAWQYKENYKSPNADVDEYQTANSSYLWGPWRKAFEVPGIAALNKGGYAVVTSISCPSSGNCSAGGVYQFDVNEDEWAFVVGEVNGIWGKAQKVRGAAAAGGIISVSCASPGNCSAGGYSNSQQAFVVSEVNGAWGKAIGVPDAATAGISESWLQSVSCGSPGNCTAGGMYQTDGGSASEAFVVTQTGGIWGRLREVPGTAALNTGGDAAVTSVSCGSAGNCSAGGNYQYADGTQVFVVTQTGGRWGNAIEVPGIARLTTRNAELNSVSCAAAGNCSAVGDTDQAAFVVNQVHGSWQTAIKVHGIPSGDGELASVSCASAGNCSAGGYYVDAVAAPFVVSETDGTWGTAATVPGTSGTGDEIATISCASAGNCGAGGGSTSGQAFVVNQTDAAWGTAGPVRGLGTGGSGLDSMSCPAVGNCAAGGSYVNSSGKEQAFLVTEYGA